MATKSTKHKQTIITRQYFLNELSPVKKQVLSDSNTGPLPSQAHSIPPDKMCRRGKKIKFIMK